jgi:hypothetical protein
VLCAWQRLTSWAQAGQAATLMTLARRRETQARELDRPSLAEHVSDEVAAALRLTGRSANQILFTAGGLDRIPDVFGSLQRGEIDWAKACLFVDQLTGLSDDDAREIAAALVGRAGGMTSGQLRAALTQAVLAHDPQAAEQRRKAARADSGLHTWTETSGNAALAGRELATTDVIHASVRLTAFARWLRKNGATGTMDQLRAAVHIALLTGRSVQSLLPHHSDAADPVTRPEPGTPDQTAAAPANAVPASAAPSSSPPADAGPASTGPADPGPASTGPASTGPARTAAPPATSAAWPPVNGALSAAALAGAAGAGWPQLTGTINLTMPMSTWLGITRNPGEVASLGPRRRRDLPRARRQHGPGEPLVPHADRHLWSGGRARLRSLRPAPADGTSSATTAWTIEQPATHRRTTGLWWAGRSHYAGCRHKHHYYTIRQYLHHAVARNQ